MKQNRLIGTTAELLPGRSREESLIYKATGRSLETLKVVQDPRGRLVITVDPAITPAELAHVYRRTRKMVWGEKRPRRLAERTKALVEAVDLSDGSTWEQRMTAWNQEHPEWAWPSSEQMGRDYRRAVQSLQDRLPEERPEINHYEEVLG